MSSRHLRVLVLGSGGREHALCQKIATSPQLQKLFCAPGSDAISQIAECAPLDILNPKEVVRFCQKMSVDMVVIGPETPLAAGVGDLILKYKIACFGPPKKAARLESSKIYAKNFMKRHHIPTADYKVFSSSRSAKNFIRTRMDTPMVVKADGLAAGKGVRVCKNRKEALRTIADLMEKKIFKSAGNSILIEDCLEGPELTAMILVDEKSAFILPFSQDHKRLKDHNKGPNTGGMGAFAPVRLPSKTEKMARSVLKKILIALKKEKMNYRGILYCGLMLTPKGPSVLEFNCRFGDPEAQAVLPLIQSDLLEVLWASARGKLHGQKLDISQDSAVCVVVASHGYPYSASSGETIRGLSSKQKKSLVFHSGTSYKKGLWKTSGGRVLSITGIGSTLVLARQAAYRAVSKIAFPKMRFRKDIAKGD